MSHMAGDSCHRRDPGRLRPSRASAKVKLLAVVALSCIGVWQLGDGLFIHAKAIVAQAMLQHAWTRTVADAGVVQHKPWPWADHWPVARLRVPEHGVDQIVLAGASGASLAFGPGHVAGTASPGTAGTSVIGGHRDTHFRFLRDLEPGTEILVERPDGQTVRLETGPGTVVDGERAALDLSGGIPVLTLVTCWPFDSLVPGGPMRYLVAAVPTDRGQVVRR